MILFRTDIDPAAGVGTFNRSVYLASLLRHRIPILFCLPGQKISSRLEKKQLSFCTPEEVMTRTETRPLSVVFDLKTYESRDLELVRWAGDQQLKTVQITDLGLDQQPVDYTIDASLQPMILYKKNKQGLFGPDYVILHTKFRHFHRIKKTPSKKIKEILMIPGGAFNYRRLRKWVELLCAHGYRLKIFPEPWLKKSHKKILKRIYPALKFVGKVETRARPFFEADVALIPADRSAYEAAACGTPALYFCTGREQEYLADNFEKLGCGYKILPEKEDRDIVAQIRSLDVCQREEMGAQGKKTVDAGGVYRIIDFFQKKAII